MSSYDFDNISLNSNIDLSEVKKKPILKKPTPLLEQQVTPEYEMKSSKSTLKPESSKVLKNNLSKNASYTKNATNAEKQNLIASNTNYLEVPKSTLKKSQSSKSVSFANKTENDSVNDLKKVKSANLKATPTYEKNSNKKEQKPLKNIRATLAVSEDNDEKSAKDTKLKRNNQKNKPDFKRQKIYPILNDSLNYAYLGLLAYLFYKYLIDMCLKHFIYFIRSLKFGFNLEYLLVFIYGILQSLIIVFIFIKTKLRSPNLRLFQVIFFGIQIVVFSVFGLIQFICGMSIWDHKYKLKRMYFAELTKFIICFIWLLIISSFKTANYYFNKKSIFE